MVYVKWCLCPGLFVLVGRKPATFLLLGLDMLTVVLKGWITGLMYHNNCNVTTFDCIFTP